MDFKQHKLKGVITNDRENLYFVGFSNFVDHFHWLNDEDLEKLINDRDSAEAPSCPYKIQPENQVNLTQNSIAKLKKKPHASQAMSGSSHIFIFWFLLDSYQKTKILAVIF